MDENKKGLTLTVSIADTGVFEVLLKIVLDVVVDERIPKEARDEYAEKLCALDEIITR